MKIYSKVSMELLDWLIDEIEQKKYNRKKMRAILNTAIKYNKKPLRIDSELKYYLYDQEKNKLSLINEFQYYNNSTERYCWVKKIIKEIDLK